MSPVNTLFTNFGEPTEAGRVHVPVGRFGGWMRERPVTVFFGGTALRPHRVAEHFEQHFIDRICLGIVFGVPLNAEREAWGAVNTYRLNCSNSDPI